MTSPVDTTVKFFHSGMPGAPVFNGVVGALISLLDACLVNGFGSLTLTSLTVSGGVATAGYSGTFPGLPESVAQIAGVTGSLTALNGEQKITAIGVGTFSFATAAANGTATGTITAKMAPAGWAKPFSGTNLAAYRSNDVASNRFYLRVNDTNAIDARVVGYETMTAISTGTNLFPTNAQLSGGGYWVKGMAANTDPLPWVVIGNGKRFWYGVAAGASPAYVGPNFDSMPVRGFGDFTSLKSTTDAYNSFLLSGNGVGSGYPAISLMGQNTGAPQLVVARLHTNAVGARLAQLLGTPNTNVDSGRTDGNGWGPINGVWAKLVLAQLRIGIDVSTHGVRGIFKEVWHTPQWIPSSTANMNFGDFLTGVEAAAGRKLLIVPALAGIAASDDGTSKARTFFDVTGPWE